MLDEAKENVSADATDGQIVGTVGVEKVCDVKNVGGELPAEVVEAVDEQVHSKSPSMTVSLFFTWILPVLVIAIFSRFGVDTEPPAVKLDNRHISIDTSYFATASKSSQLNKNRAGTTSTKKTKKKSSTARSTPSASSSANHPTSYQAILDDIHSRKRLWNPSNSRPSATRGPSGASKESTPQSAVPSPLSKQNQNYAYASQKMGDLARADLERLVEALRRNYENDRTVQKAITLADALRMKDLKYHDGGMGQQEAIQAYQYAIDETLKVKAAMQDKGEATNISSMGSNTVSQEFMIDYEHKSVDGMLCAVYAAMGKTFFMANMFERADQAYSACIEIEPLYLDAVSARGTCRIILGQYELAGKDFVSVIDNDHSHVFIDAFTGLAKVLATKEESVPSGWGHILDRLALLIAGYEAELVQEGNLRTEKQQHLYDSLNRLHHVAYSYHDVKTKDRQQAWDHLTKAYEYKMSSIEPYNFAQERQKLAALKAVFHFDFWPKGIGSSTYVPIFIIGFIRSGSTLLERVLDAHPMIVGTGEDSVFNGRLEYIRNEIVKASGSGDLQDLFDVVEEMADSVVYDMRERWKVIESNSQQQIGMAKLHVAPKRFADKMLTNYLNVGFIHMLFPNALILHVARNPMDVLWSAYKHQFPSGGLDYTSEFKSLANMYHAYRDIMRHWDRVLPGRVTHVRYEDMVHDMPGMAKAIINATGLPWDDGVLSFHKKKQAVNTLSSTQVRRGIYTDALEAWKAYETQLQPLVKLTGVETKWDLKTSLPTYTAPSEDAK